MITTILRRLTITKRLILLSIFSLSILLILGVYCTSKLKVISGYGVKIQKTVEWVVNELGKTRSLGDIRRGAALFLSSGDKEMLNTIKRYAVSLRNTLEPKNQLLLDRFLKEVNTLSIRMESLKSNEAALLEAETAIIMELDEILQQCRQDDGCALAVGKAAKAYGRYVPLGRAIITGEKVDPDQVTSIVDAIAKELGQAASQAPVSIRKRLKALAGEFYDLDDAVSTILAIRRKVEETKDKVVGGLSALDNAMQKSVFKKGEKAKEIAQTGQETTKGAVIATTVSIVVASLILIVTSFFIIRSILDPLHRIMEILKPMAEGDLRQRLNVEGRDELAMLSEHFNHFLDQMSGLIGNARQTVIALTDSSQDLNALAKRMHEEANSAVRAAEIGADQMGEVSSHMDQAAQMVENLSEATNDIARNTSETAQLAENLSERIDENRSLITTLSSHAQKVGEVINLIRSIAEQTNLLALNATIEAARAGEAGKGFAVVANEVKELAKQTADATEKIAPLISAIQSDVEKAVVSIEESVSATDLMKDSATTVAAAVEEQTATYQEINGVIQEINEAIQRLTEQIEVLKQKADDTLGHSNQVRDSAVDLRQHSRQLDEEMQGLVV